MIIYYSLLCVFMHKCWIYRRTSPLLPITKCDDEMWALPPSYSYYNKHFHPFLKKEICERDEKIPLFLAGQKKTRKDVLKLITHMKFISKFWEIEMSIGLFFQWIILSHAEATLLDLNRKLKMLLAYTELQCTYFLWHHGP